MRLEIVIQVETFGDWNEKYLKEELLKRAERYLARDCFREGDKAKIEIKELNVKYLKNDN